MKADIQLSPEQWQYILDNKLIIPIGSKYINEYGLNCIILSEWELRRLMEHISDTDIILRPTLQKSGNNMFGWRK